MIALLATALIVSVVSIALIGLMHTDLTHASIQFAVSRSFYLAQAGLAEAKAQVSAAADPAAYATPDRGVTIPYGSGRYSYWVDAGPAEGCGPGFKTLEALGETEFLGRTIGSRVRACAVGGTPMLAALFGVGRVQFQGAASRVYLAPYQVGTPGGGASLGSFTEINFADTDTRVNALSDATTDIVTLRDGTFADYQLFGFPTRPDYNPNPEADPVPWLSSVFGDIIKAKPATGLMPNRCGTSHACVTVANGLTDVQGISELREADYVRHVYAGRIREDVVPPLALDPETFRAQAAQNTANAWINKELGFPKDGSAYDFMEFYRIVAYLAVHSSRTLEGTIFVDGSFQFIQSVNLGDITLALRGDLIVDNKAALTIRHDLSTVAGRRAPGILAFGFPDPVKRVTAMCRGQRVNGSGRLIVCPGTTLTVDGLVYTQDGMAVESGALVDQIGAMYHHNRGTPNPSFANRNATVVVRFDPLALSVFGKGFAILSWQQLPGPGAAVPGAASQAATLPGPAAPTSAPPPSAAQSALGVQAHAAAPAVGQAPHAAARQGSRALASLGTHAAASERPGAEPVPSHTASGPAPVPPTVLVGGPKYHVQAGAYANREFADDLARRLRARGYTVTLVEGPLIRVRIGAPMLQEAAQRLAAELNLKGFEATLIPAR